MAQTPGEQMRHRRTASWRCQPLASGLRDPYVDQHAGDWNDTEIDAWQAAAEHLRTLGLYGQWQLPVAVRRTTRRTREKGAAA